MGLVGLHAVPDRTNVRTAAQRDRATVLRIKMYKSGGKAVRDKRGRVVAPAPFQSRTAPGQMARIAPNRKWFGNTRVVGQKELAAFRTAVAEAREDPYNVVLRQRSLPMSLLEGDAVSGAAAARRGKAAGVLATRPFEATFGPHAVRKRPVLSVDCVERLREAADAATAAYDPAADTSAKTDTGGERPAARDWCMHSGQSKRIWGELYKVIDSSDVLIQVLDARDPEGMRCTHIEEYLRTTHPHKHLVLLLNKCDLVPVWVTKRWVGYLSRLHPTIAFRASITNPYGKGSLIALLRQFAKLHNDKRQISVGFIGYPNVGKSSVINTLSKKKVCNVAPIPGETKVWQYITLMKRVFLIDCPGVVPTNTDEDVDVVLKGVVSCSYCWLPVSKPEMQCLRPWGLALCRCSLAHAPARAALEGPRRAPGVPLAIHCHRTGAGQARWAVAMRRAHRGARSRSPRCAEYIRRLYGVDPAATPDAAGFLDALARRSGRLLKGGEPDVETVRLRACGCLGHVRER